MLSDSGSILAANSAALELFRAAHLVGMSFPDLVTDLASRVSDSLNNWTSSRRMVPASFNLHKVGTGAAVRCEGGLLQGGDTSNPSLVLVRCLRKNDPPALEMLGFSARGIAVELDFQPMPALMLDGDQMKEAIINLCKNAEEAMPNGGRLTIKGRVREQEKVAVLEVSDTGIGVPAGVDVFQLFMTTKPGASGLGLPIAAQIIASHGGRIQCIAEPAPGTTFEILLPLSHNS